MKYLKVFLLFLLIAPSALAQTDSTKVKNDFVSNVLTTTNTLRVGLDRLHYILKEPTHTSRLFMNYTDKE